MAIDFDGVLHSYLTGWKGADVIPDPPTEGAQAFVDRMLAAGWDVPIVSTRAREPEGCKAIQAWLLANEFPVGLRVDHRKPPALVYLDDRALRFDGIWPTMAMIETASRPWNR